MDEPYIARVLPEHPHGAPYIWLPADWPIGATVIVQLVPGDVARDAVAAVDLATPEKDNDGR
jgi:hypothetical protein